MAIMTNVLRCRKFIILFIAYTIFNIVFTTTSFAERYKHISTGGMHTCYVADNASNENQMYCFGHNAYGQLGDGTFSNKTEPTLITNSNINNKNIKHISASTTHTCAVIENSAGDDSMYCWGDAWPAGAGGGSAIKEPNLIADTAINHKNI